MLFFAEVLIRFFTAQKIPEVEAVHPLPSVSLALILGKDKRRKAEKLWLNLEIRSGIIPLERDWFDPSSKRLGSRSSYLTIYLLVKFIYHPLSTGDFGQLTTLK